MATTTNTAGLALRALRYTVIFAWVSLAWMAAEGGFGLFAGIEAGSVALISWALGSVIEGLASIIVIWRFTGTRTLSESSERTAQRAVAISFWLLAPYITIQAVRALATHSTVDKTTLGIAITATSIIVMPFLGFTKRRLGRQVNSRATAGEGTQNLLCAAQAAAVLIGLAANAWFDASWLDPTIAILLAAWAVREGGEAWRGEDCY